MTQANQTPEWGELDQIDAAHEDAATIDEYLAADDRFFEINPDIRRAWLDGQMRALGITNID